MLTDIRLDLRCIGVMVLVAGSATCAALAQGQVVGWGGGGSPPTSLLKPTQVSCGGKHAYALNQDGTVFGWGLNDSQQLDTPAGLGAVTQVVCGGSHTYVLRNDGTIVGWGDNASGQLDTPIDGPRFEQISGITQIACGAEHTVALLLNGRWYGWGRNDEGQLTPPFWWGEVPSQLACGAYFTYALRPDGTALGWGQHDEGQLDAPTWDSFRQISCGRAHVCAVKPDGTVMAWGANNSQQTDVPQGLSDVQQVACGGDHTCALRADGTVVGWGFNGYGQAQPPANLQGALMVSCGDLHSYALTSDGTLVGWGDNRSGQLGSPASAATRFGVVQIACGASHAYSLKADGALVGSGSNVWGQIDTPPGLSGVTQVACGANHTYAVQADGTLVGWGESYTGATNTPFGLTGVVQVACGDGHTYARLIDGTIEGWGRSDLGQTSTPFGLSGVTQVACGWYHSYAVRDDGTAIGWGGEPFWGGNETNTPADLTGVMNVACGRAHTCALKADGTVVGWGSGSAATDIPPGLSDVVQIACGEWFACALKADGTVTGWGVGPIDPPPGLANVTQIACGGSRVQALLAPEVSTCASPVGAGTATIAASGASWQQVGVWSWDGAGGVRVPGEAAGVDFGDYGSVGSECAAQCDTLLSRSGSSLLVPASASEAGNDHSIRVGNSANLAGRLWLLGVSGANGVLPEDLNLPVLSAGTVQGNFDLIQSELPPPPGFFLTLVPEDVNGRTVFSLRLLPLPGNAELSGASAGAYSGSAVAAETIDVNQDGFDDLALAVDFGPDQNGLIQILLNDGTGGLGASNVLESIPPQPTCMAIGDFDDDGRADAVVGIASDQSVRVYLDNGQGGLSAGVEITDLGGAPASVIVIPPGGASLRPGGASVGVGVSGSKLKIYSSGALRQEITLAGVPSTVRGGNTGGTQGRDIVTGGSKSASIDRLNAAETGFVQVLRLQPDGLYAVEQSMFITARPTGMDVADLDGDGLDDIVTTNAEPRLPALGSALPVLSIFRNTSGIFGGGVPYQPAGASGGVDVSLIDVDNDGDRDIVSVHRRVGTDSEAALLRVDTLGPGTPISIGQTTVLDASDPIMSARGNLDGVGGEDLYLVSEPAANALTGMREVKPFVAAGGARQGDLDGDGVVGTSDISILLLDFGPCGGCPSDLDGSGEVDNGDIAFLLLLFD